MDLKQITIRLAAAFKADACTVNEREGWVIFHRGEWRCGIVISYEDLMRPSAETLVFFRVWNGLCRDVNLKDDPRAQQPSGEEASYCLAQDEMWPISGDWSGPTGHEKAEMLVTYQERLRKFEYLCSDGPAIEKAIRRHRVK